MRLKRWESPRKQGRNNKGKGGSARKRQLKKQQQMLRQKLKGKDKLDNQSQNNQKRRQGEEKLIFPLFFCLYSMVIVVRASCPLYVYNLDA
ncbi:MAG: hypothetical protein QNJ51_15880 [Calothrix sp. MO_167.B12]|nr:hypothetical protein [Calothrix sp. MO_167.B12]